VRRIRLAGQLAEPISHYTDAVEALLPSRFGHEP
jgi:hypothetical protein